MYHVRSCPVRLVRLCCVCMCVDLIVGVEDLSSLGVTENDPFESEVGE